MAVTMMERDEVRGRYGRYSELESFRKDAIQAAKDLFYGDIVIDLLKKAETIGEISRIMGDARRGKYSCVYEED